MLELTIALFMVSLIAEGAAIALIFSEARAAQRALRDWTTANPQNNDGGSWGQVAMLNVIIRGLLGEPAKRYAAAVLIAVGLVAGSAGNFASLAL